MDQDREGIMLDASNQMLMMDTLFQSLRQSPAHRVTVLLPEDSMDGERTDAFGRQDADTADKGVNDQGSHGRVRLYELILGIAFLYGIAVYFIWQQSAQRINMLDEEVAVLRNMVGQQQNTIDGGMISREIVAMGAGRLSSFYQFETQYLRFETSVRTAALVQSIVLLCDLKYRQLHQDFGLALPSPSDKVTVVIDQVAAPGPNLDANTGQGDRTILVKLSPTSTAERFGITETGVTTNDIFVQLTDYVLEQAIQQRKIKPQWSAMTMALQLYLQLENGHNDRWPFHAAFLPRRHLAQNRTIDLVLQMTNESAGEGAMARPASSAYAVADPLIEYIIKTYGYDQIPSLLDAFAEHDSWQTLIPAEFGMNVAEFEENWHLYLHEQYPLPEE